MDHLHFYVYEYSEKQKNVHKIFIRTPTEQIVLQHQPKTCIKTREVQAQKVQKSNYVTQTVESLKKRIIEFAFHI